MRLAPDSINLTTLRSNVVKYSSLVESNHGPIDLQSTALPLS